MSEKKLVHYLDRDNIATRPISHIYDDADQGFVNETVGLLLDLLLEKGILTHEDISDIIPRLKVVLSKAKPSQGDGNE